VYGAKRWRDGPADGTLIKMRLIQWVLLTVRMVLCRKSHPSCHHMISIQITVLIMTKMPHKCKPTCGHTSLLKSRDERQARQTAHAKVHQTKTALNMIRME